MMYPKIKRTLLNKHGSKAFSVLCRPSWSVLGLRSFLCFFHLLLFLMARLLILNWLELLPFFMDNFMLISLLLDGGWLLFFGRGLLLLTSLAMSYVTVGMRFLLSDILLTFAVGTLDFLTFTVVALNLITRFDSLGVHLAVGTHLRGCGRAHLLRLSFTVLSISSREFWHSSHGILEGVLHLLLHPGHVVVHGLHFLTDAVLEAGHLVHGLSKHVSESTFSLGISDLMFVLSMGLFPELTNWLLQFFADSVGAINDLALTIFANSLFA